MVYVSALGAALVPITDVLTLYAQSYADGTITLPFTAKADEAQTTSATQAQVLTRRLAPVSLANAVSAKEVSKTMTGDNTVFVDGMKFFLDEKLLMALNIVGTVRFKTLVQVKSANASGTAYLQRVTFKLRALTANDTYRDIATRIVTVNVSTASTTYVDKEVIGTVDITSDQSITTGEKLLLEITTDGKASSGSYAAYHNLKFSVASGETYVEFGVLNSNA